MRGEKQKVQKTSDYSDVTKDAMNRNEIKMILVVYTYSACSIHGRSLCLPWQQKCHLLPPALEDGPLLPSDKISSYPNQVLLVLINISSTKIGNKKSLIDGNVHYQRKKWRLPLATQFVQGYQHRSASAPSGVETSNSSLASIPI